MEIINAQIISELKQQTIGTILSKYQPSKEAQEILEVAWSPQHAVQQLLKNELERDAIQLIAHGLPVMVAIRWGGRVLKQKQDMTTEGEKLLHCVENWLQSPNETLRIRSQQLAERIGLDTDIGWLGYAVFWSGTGSIVAPELPVVMPPDNMVGHAINAAILLSMIDRA
ncbi:hypothetical protein PCIT_a2341 [Pseudoalteromonas citrea]|uniref:Uncharacterized protein n=2 Tax=Pseudoalteromonas citrea TaxID=43655 RepID=A0AAD4AJZ9_9GAMM|nr:hypothetical protein [Pseudoalteromonas citrea]KAF7772295.1 hypothetical protein PCIT_a2341 [Pseudoalteromonas citrea]